ncbi:acetyl-CoA synthetase-like protein [Aureobasidium melanogenum CBS 110374]|uniref:Acetyl-CoA synthetase-like protein n=1 Tax=Aureobasidium melanogenum (strain CBS 110374) TaxID=1043003 RepID=A0A074VVM8_AURM1|nr:acetyl-CoA synthetase-like protein [Aureobasidium melanogenum CBS 110374]KEQ63309.1 acetyl-CoA synthetase-like protein [Aureobasidium melanogenum CBS 110374]
MVYRPSEYREVPPVDLLSWIFENNGVDPEIDILIDAANHGNRLNTRQAVSLIRKLIAGFRMAGLEAGDTVCVHAFNSILYPLLYFGIIGAGGTFVGSNPAYKSLEIRHLLSITKPRFLLVEASLVEIVLPAVGTCIPTSKILVLDTEPQTCTQDSFKCWKSLLQHGEHDWIRISNEMAAKSTIAVLQLTSGTTGLPKAAATSHYALVAAGVAMRSSEKRPYEISRLISLPLFHSFGASFVQISAFHYDKPTYVMRRFNAEGFIQALNRSKVTETAVVPAMLASIVRQRIPPNMLKRLRRIWCAGSSLSPRLSKAMYELLHGDAVISQVWGMTEFGRITSSEWCEKDDGSVGKLLPNTEARVIDKQGFEVVDAGVQGELEIRGPSMMNEYSDCPTGTVETLRSGWLKTGDFGYVKNDKVYIVGRIKELIKVRGWQVSPNEIEDVLLMHPSIIDAAVIGVSRSGTDPVDELPRAYVVINKEEPVSVDDLEVMRFVQDRLASFKALGGGVEFVDSIPRSHSGKILRHELRQRAMSKLATRPIEAETESQ